MSNWMIDWLKAWEKATRPAGEEDCHTDWSGLRFNEDGYLEVDPVPAGADPVWQPGTLLCAACGKYVLVAMMGNQLVGAGHFSKMYSHETCRDGWFTRTQISFPFSVTKK